MAVNATVADLRVLIDELTDAEPWTDVYLASVLESWTGSLNALAASLWRRKAAEYSGLVDIQEGSSSRKLSQLQSQALRMAEGLDTAAASEGTSRRYATTRKIERL